MEIALVANDSIRIKGKSGIFLVNPSGKSISANGIFTLGNQQIDKSKIEDDSVILKGPGEYELASIKITGVRYSDETIFSFRIDSIDVVLGRGEVIEKDHAKLKEHNIVILYADTLVNPSFVTALAPSVVIFYGASAEGSIQQLAKEGFKRDTKYVTTADKLPAEMEEILLQ
jgi:hypothetical protein